MISCHDKFGRGYLNPSFGNNIALVPWDKLAGAGTCLDQLHCVVVESLDRLQFNSKQMGFNLFFSCLRPALPSHHYGHTLSVVKSAGCVPTNALTWLI